MELSLTDEDIAIVIYKPVLPDAQPIQQQKGRKEWQAFNKQDNMN